MAEPSAGTDAATTTVPIASGVPASTAEADHSLDAATTPISGSGHYSVDSITKIKQAISRAEVHRDSRLDATLRATVEAQAPGVTAVDVEILTPATSSIQAAVEALGGTVTGSVPGQVLQARVPASALGALDQRPDVIQVRQPVSVSVVPVDATRATTQEAAGPAIAQAGSVTGAEVAKLNVANWHAAGVDGSGVRIGIIDFFDSGVWAQALAAGDVPSPAGMFCLHTGIGCSVLAPNGGVHGVAVAEVVHEVAPGASLYLADVQTVSDLMAAVQWFENNGVKVISRSLAAVLDGPGNGTGPIAQVAAYAAQHGMTWLNSAGNSAAGSYYRSGALNPDGDEFLNLLPGATSPDLDATEIMIVDGCGLMMGMRWSDWGAAGGRSDYDLFRLDAATFDLIDSYTNNQQAGAPPIEGPYLQCETELVVAQIFSPGTSINGDVIEMIANGLVFERFQAAYSVNQPVSDSSTPGVLAVGAVDPAAGTAIANYSGRGPTNDGRIKPDVVAASCVATVAYGPAECFSGTSASAPAAAGAASLAIQSGWAVSPAEVHAFLESSATDRAAGGSDNNAGHGEIVLPNYQSVSAGAGPSRFVPLAPSRIVNTVAGIGAPAAVVPNGGMITVQVAGVAGVPTNASAVVLNLTATASKAAGYLQAFPTGHSRLGASSNVNMERAGQVVPNLAIVPVGIGGKITVFTRGGSHVVADLFGYFEPAASSPSGRYVGLAGKRVLNTVAGIGFPSGGKPRPAGSVTTLAIRSAIEAIDPAATTNGVAAVILNVTASGPLTQGYVQVIPTGGSTALRASSNLNYSAGQTVPNLVIVPVGADGSVTLFTSGTTHLVADVFGYFTASFGPTSSSGLFVPVVPARLYATSLTGPPIPAKGAKAFSPLGVAGVPGAGVGGVVLNMTATHALAPGYVQVLPNNQATFGAYSNLNIIRPGQTIPNSVITKLGDGGAFTAYSSAGTHLVADLFGYMTS